jgi:predicted nucleic acid-binding protein
LALTVPEAARRTGRNPETIRRWIREGKLTATGELAAGFPTIEDLDASLPEDLYRREAIPFSAAFLAGKAQREYRERGGLRRTPLADFYVGAHAAVAGYRLLTRDAARYRTYFPRLEIITPN